MKNKVKRKPDRWITPLLHPTECGCSYNQGRPWMRRAHQLRCALSWKGTGNCSYHFPPRFKECIKYNLIIKENIVVSRNRTANLPPAVPEWKKAQHLKSHFFPQSACTKYTQTQTLKRQWFPHERKYELTVGGFILKLFKIRWQHEADGIYYHVATAYIASLIICFLSHIRYFIPLWKYCSSKKIPTTPSYASLLLVTLSQFSSKQVSSCTTEELKMTHARVVFPGCRAVLITRLSLRAPEDHLPKILVWSPISFHERLT